jgi:hypothetical protein
MQHSDLATLLLYSTLINYAILLCWVILLRCCKERIWRIHRYWFNLNDEQFSYLHYQAMAFYKIIVLFFNLVPWLIISFVLN